MADSAEHFSCGMIQTVAGNRVFMFAPNEQPAELLSLDKQPLGDAPKTEEDERSSSIFRASQH